ncbi:ArsR/SmtB family transcription factor [Actinotalea ferrariae]|uniref:ArsR/SmtB family transcription factor n=1 Tax=Actinotalea ferrariae TaxID=1386098 RepID=UPI001C8C91A5|nr:winged helix-turn-helix domain-containing protein [Actinotalea ferrariae]
MLTAESVARFVAVLADRSRVAMCLALLDDRAWTAGELARHVGIAPSTASEHLDLLVGARILADVRQGRHRYVRLADPAMASLVEDLAATAGVPQRPTSSRTVRAGHRLAAARTCYDHLAGRLGVGLFDAMVGRGLLSVTDGLALTDDGAAWFGDLCGDGWRPSGTRVALRTCLDWTERRSHLGGALAATLRAELVRRAWVVSSGTDRSVTVTPAGARGLSEVLDLGSAVLDVR